MVCDDSVDYSLPLKLIGFYGYSDASISYATLTLLTYSVAWENFGDNEKLSSSSFSTNISTLWTEAK